MRVKKTKAQIDAEIAGMRRVIEVHKWAAVRLKERWAGHSFLETMLERNKATIEGLEREIGLAESERRLCTS